MASRMSLALRLLLQQAQLPHGTSILAELTCLELGAQLCQALGCRQWSSLPVLIAGQGWTWNQAERQLLEERFLH